MRAGGTTTEWRKLRGVVFRTMGDACYMCGDKATEIDHIIERAEGGTDDLENLQPLCNTCHKGKTAKYNQERIARMMKARQEARFFSRRATQDTSSGASLSPKNRVIPPFFDYAQN